MILVSSCVNIRNENSAYKTGLLEFPRDFAPHRDYSLEWWYQTGVLNDGRFGYELTLFRTYRPDHEKWPKIGEFPVGELWVVHAMIYDYKTGERIFREYIVFPSLVFVGNSVKTGVSGMFLYYNGVNFQVIWIGDFNEMETYFEDDYLKLDLNLKINKKPVAHNGGIVSMGNVGESYYYSLTNIEVNGTVRLNGKYYDVTGTTWIDQQWGDFGPVPWEWFSLRLDNDVEMMLFRFPGRDVGFGSVVLKDGGVITLNSEDFYFEFYDSVKDSNGDEVALPHPGKIFIPSLNTTLVITSLATDEFNRSALLPEYWEGLCEVHGTFEGEGVKGWAFYEGWR